jgi:hypothetical protein
MTQKNNVIAPPIQTLLSAKPILIGAGTGLILISLFLLGVDDPNPEWGKLWMIKPLIMVTAAGAGGGAVYTFLNQLRRQGKMNKAIAILLSLVVYIIGLFLGTVLGLDGTLWN